jgi:hypothetical protein
VESGNETVNPLRDGMGFLPEVPQKPVVQPINVGSIMSRRIVL